MTPRPLPRSIRLPSARLRSLPVVGDVNLWGGPTYVSGRGYVQLANNGAMRHRGFGEIEVTPECVSITEDLDWWAPGEHLVCTEKRRFVVTLTEAEDAWILLYRTSFTNLTSDPLAIGSPTSRGRPDAGYGGLFSRAPRSFAGGVVRTPTGCGTDEFMGSRHPWLGFVGRHDEHAGCSTLVFVDAESNPGHPTRWFVRREPYPGVCPAPFFAEDMRVDPGQRVSFVYAVVVADGDRGGDGVAALAAGGMARLADPFGGARASG